MLRISWVVFSLLIIHDDVRSNDSFFGKDPGLEICRNDTGQPPDVLQPLDFKCRHPKPIGILTTSAGAPVDIRETFTLNTDSLKNTFHLDLLSHFVNERIPERVVHAKGAGAFGYFVVTHDVSKYTKADVFNGIGKKTPLFVRMSQAMQRLGGTDLGREFKGMAIKFYTKEGNLDFLNLNQPVFLFRDPMLLPENTHATGRNPSSNLMMSGWDFITLKPEEIHATLWLASDRGIPNGYRKMDSFTIHTFELTNHKGERYFARFNFRTEQGIENLTSEQARQIQGLDPDYYTRDLYNNIALKNYPSWRLEMDILSLEDLKRIDYNPFDITQLWKNGTYTTCTIGRLVLNKNTDNAFKEMEQSAFCPSHLVPGISDPPDELFKTRKLAYRQTQNHRLGANHNRIEINLPKYHKTYNRDGEAPVRDNGKDSPNYYPNSYNGPIPIVDETRPKNRIYPLTSNAIDLQQPHDFYNKILTDDGQRQRLADNIVQQLLMTAPPVHERAIKLLTLVDIDLGKRVNIGLKAAIYAAQAKPRTVDAMVNNMKIQYHEFLSKKEDDRDDDD